MSDPVVVKFCNEVARPLSDRRCQLYVMARAAVVQWKSKGVADLVAADVKSVVADGSVLDGRTPLTGEDVQVVMAAVSAWVDAMDANGQAELLACAKLAVNFLP